MTSTMSNRETTMRATKTVIITGASSGMGLTIAKSYLDLGYNVVGNGRSIERLQAASASLGHPENFLLVAGDIGERATTDILFEQAIARFGKVDILVSNAGMFISKPFVDFTDDEIDAIVSTNLKGFVYPARAAAQHMSLNGTGHIVAITATIAMQPNVKLPALLSVLIKGGLNQAVKGLAIELASSNVQVNAVAPGIIDTPLHPSRDESYWGFMRSLAPNGKTGVTQDVADAVLYLTGSDYISGSILTVDGGSTAGTW